MDSTLRRSRGGSIPYPWGLGSECALGFAWMWGVKELATSWVAHWFALPFFFTALICICHLPIRLDSRATNDKNAESGSLSLFTQASPEHFSVSPSPTCSYLTSPFLTFDATVPLLMRSGTGVD